MKKRNMVLGMGLAAALALTGCSGGGDASGDGGSGDVVKGGTLHVLATTDFSHLDPAQGWDGGVNNFYRLIYRTLTTYAPGNAEDPAKIVPDLATDLGTPNEDNTEWTFTLKDDIFFQDGSEITSEDVRFGVERSLDPAIAVGSPYAKILLAGADEYGGVYEDGHLDSIETPDDKTIVFHLKEPFADFSSAVAQPVYTPFPADGNVTTKSIDKQPISSGPYVVTDYKPGSTIVLERNEYWEQGSDEVRTANPDKFVWTLGLDNSTIDERMIADQGDDKNAITGIILASSLSRIQEPSVQERTLEGLKGCTTYLALNTTKEPLNDVKVRQAISYAIDKKSVQTATGGPALADIANTMLPPSVTGHEDFDLYPSDENAGDPKKAKELLAEAGYADGFELSLDMRAVPVTQAQAESIQESLAKANIDVKLNVVDTAKYWQIIGTPSQQTDAAIAGWCPDWPTGATFLPPLFEGSQIFDQGNSNVAQFDNDEVNTRMDEIRAMTDVDEANKAWGALDKQILESAPAVPLTWEKTVTVTGSNIANAYLHIGYSGGIDYAIVGVKSVDE
ncbi:ABC transporter substrate-binding protein [Paramicrobacterium chengjingii]|uniref:ABC transporter substrate-binding protein n=1 Tax=Paramicrobacterium chengjingii TaxID=2769067 RepID=A0ABX6YGZ4_9MICO|nr:ABC transporter substrate-binding protein [Microbacterium chengjingii]QPZ38066.1 ABC transporter substrate-binding protein [Microbacterium chengjingii]